MKLLMKRHFYNMVFDPSIKMKIEIKHFQYLIINIMKIYILTTTLIKKYREWWTKNKNINIFINIHCISSLRPTSFAIIKTVFCVCEVKFSIMKFL